jgi:hypothetical protein
MKRSKAALALTLAASIPASGCATVHLGGIYRTKATDIVMKEPERTLDEGSTWPLFWGLFIAGSYDANRELAKKLRPDEEVAHLQVRERLSVGGIFLWLVTAGIVSHHTVEIRGATAVVSRPPAEPATGAAAAPAEREGVTPAGTQPAGYHETTAPPPLKSGKSADYNEGYRDGMRDKGRVEVTGDGPVRPDRSADYNGGYRDAIKGR